MALMAKYVGKSGTFPILGFRVRLGVLVWE